MMESQYTKTDHRAFEAREAGVKTDELCPEQGISAATFYGWKSKFGGMEVSEAQQLKAIEDENRSLKLLVAEMSPHGEESLLGSDSQ